jgi:hypothetical protein
MLVIMDDFIKDVKNKWTMWTFYGLSWK